MDNNRPKQIPIFYIITCMIEIRWFPKITLKVIFIFFASMAITFIGTPYFRIQLASKRCTIIVLMFFFLAIITIVLSVKVQFQEEWQVSALILLYHCNLYLFCWCNV